MLLFKARKAIAADRPTALSSALGFLYRDVRPSFYCTLLSPRIERRQPTEPACLQLRLRVPMLVLRLRVHIFFWSQPTTK